MKNIQINHRVAAIRISTCLFFIVAIFMTIPLWRSGRLFPLCPISDLIPPFHPGLDALVITLIVIALVLGMIFHSRLIFGIILFMILFMFIQDQMRWQPWAYLYFSMLIPFVVKKHDAGFINYLQILLVGLYLWGGLHKFSPDFINGTFTDILKRLFGIDNQETIASLYYVGYLIPLIEVSIALALIFPKSRKIGVIGAISMHVFILIYLIKIDYNYVVYPWNTGMIIFVIALFYKNPSSLKIWRGFPLRIRILNLLACIFFLVAPILSSFNLWDHYLSLRLYSGKTNLFYVVIDESELDKIDSEFQHYLWKSKRLESGKLISLNKWSMGELNVPFYPETRVFKQVAKSFCELGIEQDKLTFIEINRSLDNDSKVSFKCGDLK